MTQLINFWDADHEEASLGAQLYDEIPAVGDQVLLYLDPEAIPDTFTRFWVVGRTFDFTENQRIREQHRREGTIMRHTLNYARIGVHLSREKLICG